MADNEPRRRSDWEKPSWDLFFEPTVVFSLMGVGYLVSYLLGEEWHFLHYLAYIAIVSILAGIGVGIIVLRRRSRQSQP